MKWILLVYMMGVGYREQAPAGFGVEFGTKEACLSAYKEYAKQINSAAYTPKSVKAVCVPKG